MNDLPHITSDDIDLILADRINYTGTSVDRGDHVVYHMPSGQILGVEDTRDQAESLRDDMEREYDLDLVVLEVV